MIAALVLAVLTAAPLVQDPEPPDEEQVRQAVAELKAAFGKDGDTAARLDALASTADVLDPKVIAFHANAVRHRDVEVRRAALGYLGTMQHPEALDSLHGIYKRDRALRKDGESLAILIRSIGMHAHVDSIPLLADSALSEREFQVSRARIYSLGNVRDERSVERLMAMMTQAGRHRTQPHMENIRVAMMVLTGVDQGTSQDAWLAWWNDNKKTYEVSLEPPKLPRSIQTRWNEYWGLRRPVERRTKRTERGGDGAELGG